MRFVGDIGAANIAVSGAVTISGHVVTAASGTLFVDGQQITGTGGGSSGSGTSIVYVHTQASPSSTWTVTHNLGSSNYTYAIFDDGASGIVPNSIHTDSANQITILHSVPTAGSATFMFQPGTGLVISGSMFFFTQSTPALTWTIQHNFNTSGYLIQTFDSSGSVFFPNEIKTIDLNTTQVVNAFARTGSATIVGRPVSNTSSSAGAGNGFIGTPTRLASAAITSGAISGYTTLYQVPSSSYIQNLKLLATNRNSATTALVSMAVNSGGATTPPNSTFLLYQTPLLPNETKIITVAGATGNRSGDLVSVASDLSGVTFIATGLSGTTAINQSILASLDIDGSTRSGSVDYVAYVSPAGNNASLSFFVCNRDGSSSNVRMALVNSGAVAQGSTITPGANGYTDDTYFIYDDLVSANSTKNYTGSPDNMGVIDISQNQSIIFRSSATNVNIVVVREQ